MKAFTAIVAISIAAAVAYGVLHDLITAHFCVEYFTIGHPPIFATSNPVLLALGWGVAATWWAGLIIGLGLGAAAVTGSRPKRSPRSLGRPMMILLLVMAGCAAMGALAGRAAAHRGWIALLEPLASRVPANRHIDFITVGAAHSTSYLVGFIGGTWLVIGTIRWRIKRASYHAECVGSR